MDVALTDLWLPILLSAVGVFVVSSILHMVLPIHKGDTGEMPGEAQILEVMRSHGVNPGQYMFPCPKSMKEMGSPEMIAKYEQGPVGQLNVMRPGMPSMGRSLGLWFLYSLLVGVLAAYTATLALPRGADYMLVFRFVATVAVAGYAIGVVNDTIWKGVRWCVTIKYVVDGLFYALVTGGVFASLWPAAT